MNNSNKTFTHVVLAVGFLLFLPQIKYLGLALAAWALLPYLIYFVVTARLKYNNGAVIGAGIPILCIDFFSRMSILFFPGSSTAPIGLLFLPLFLIMIVLPAGLVIGWFVQYLLKFSRKTKGR